MSVELIRAWMTGRQVWLYRESIDFRKQMNGLIQVIAQEMEQESRNGSIYVFRNRKKDKVKLLVWDRNGYVMGYKRLEKGKFDWPDHEEQLKLRATELWDILSGMPVVRVSSDKRPMYIN